MTDPDREALAVYPPLLDAMDATLAPHCSEPVRGLLAQPHVLTEMQRYGLRCVHCDTELKPGAAVELGTQYDEDPILGRVAWFPRACRDCHTRQGAA
ncbi:hypothetical protein [Streptomyces sp. TRM64462]|uniref:hypothetical protein n=1 Tax=Streptomyces sp. TRM64462 TaxID=2741726 RepID=UPI0015867085|nr:hypothetical protein [Streptomyces sp. TRM64462]